MIYWPQNYEVESMLILFFICLIVFIIHCYPLIKQAEKEAAESKAHNDKLRRDMAERYLREKGFDPNFPDRSP